MFCAFASCKEKPVSELLPKQERAKAAVIEYIHCNPDSAKRINFTNIDSNNIIGIEHGAVYHTHLKKGQFSFAKTLWFSLDTSCTKVKGMFTY
jgi:hypothetical protein